MSVIGILFRTYTSNRAGAEVMGLLQLVMSVYFPACTLASSGVYVASTRLCAEAIAKNNGKIRGILNRCMIYGVLFGAGSFLLLFFGAGWIAREWLSYPDAEIPLKILSFGLPFLSVANALQGFFLSLRKAAYSTVLQITEDLSKIGSTALLFTFFLNRGPLAALCALVGGMAVGEIVSCLIGYALYLRQSHSALTHLRKPCYGIFPEIFKIALPCAFSGYLRSAMGMVEGVLVPRGLQTFGLTPEQALAALGKFEGMALPILVFPATFLAVVSKLLVPEITAENALGHNKNNIQTIDTLLKSTMTYGVFIGTFALLFGKELGRSIYHDETCGTYLMVLAPFVPILYGDRVIDGIMKGYNQQLTTMKINLADAGMQTVGAWILIPRTGIDGYIFLFCVGGIFNFSLSLYTLKKTCNIRFPLRSGVIKPIFLSLAAMLPLRVLQNFIPLSLWITGAASVLLFLFFHWNCADQKTVKWKILNLLRK